MWDGFNSASDSTNLAEMLKSVRVPYGDAEAGHRPPLLQVGFSVQVGRLNVANAIVV